MFVPTEVASLKHCKSRSFLRLPPFHPWLTFWDLPSPPQNGLVSSYENGHPLEREEPCRDRAHNAILTLHPLASVLGSESSSPLRQAVNFYRIFSVFCWWTTKIHAWTTFKKVACVLKYEVRTDLTCVRHAVLHLCACSFLWEMPYTDPSSFLLKCESSAEEECVRACMCVFM